MEVSPFPASRLPQHPSSQLLRDALPIALQHLSSSLLFLAPFLSAPQELPEGELLPGRATCNKTPSQQRRGKSLFPLIPYVLPGRQTRTITTICTSAVTEVTVLVFNRHQQTAVIDINPAPRKNNNDEVAASVSPKLPELAEARQLRAVRATISFCLTADIPEV